MQGIYEELESKVQELLALEKKMVKLEKEIDLLSDKLVGDE